MISSLSQPPGDLPTGLLLIGHGTRSLIGIAELRITVEQVQQLCPEWRVEGCFLELSEPTIAQGVGNLARRGIQRIVAVPVLLFAAGHARHDIPTALAAAAREHPGVEILQAGVLEHHPQILELSAKRFQEAVVFHEIVLGRKTGRSSIQLIMVARGSSDPEASAAMREFARLRAERIPVGNVEVCYMAIAQPSVNDAFERAKSWKAGPIVVQPHFLFQGELLQELGRKVTELDFRGTRFRWWLTKPLGPDILLAEALLDLGRQAANSPRL